MTDESASAALPRAAVSACVFRNNELLLVRRSKPPFVGAWSLPGGSIEPGETAETAIRREIAEETGLAIVVAGVAGVNDVILRDSKGVLNLHYTIIVFAATAIGHRAPVAASDAAEAAFFARDAPCVAGLGRSINVILDQASRIIPKAIAEMER